MTNWNEKLTLREMESTDAPAVESFFDAMGGETRALFNRRDYNRRGALRQCGNPDKTRRYYLAEVDGEMVGYLFFMDFHSSIPQLGLAVRDDMQGQGIGRALVGHAIDLVKGAGKGGIQLTTHVANLRAQTLYESMGFTLVGPTKNGTEFFYLYRFYEN